MENEQDKFISDKLREDTLISKKADDVFNNFFKTTIHKIEISNDSKINEVIDDSKDSSKIKSDNVISFEEVKKRRGGFRNLLSAVASLMIIFLVSNVYATTKGYDNIFFMIKDKISHEEIVDREEILEDRDLTISYQSIEIAEGVKLQINKLIVTENEAKLFIRINEEKTAIIHPEKYIVYDITDGSETIVGTKEISIVNSKDNYFEEIVLNGIKNSTSKLKLEIKDKTNSEIISLEIDLENKEIDVTSSMITEIQKLSEIELKELLAKYVQINVYKDFKENVGKKYTQEELLNTQKVLIAMDLINKKESSLEEVNKAIYEFTGEEIVEPLNITDDIIYYSSKDKMYKYNLGDKSLNPLCLKIENISFLNGIYTVTFDYCYPTDEDWNDGTIENLDIYKTTLYFRLNSDYKYSKYCFINIDNIESEKIK